MPPLCILVKPASSRCNMHCTYCFYADVTSKRTVADFGIMTESTQSTMVKKAFDFADESVCFVFQGGEPTLAGMEYFRRHIKLCKEFNRKKIKVMNTIQTNGILVDDAWSKFFRENDFLVGLSMDGPQKINDCCRKYFDGTGSFEKIEKAIYYLEKHKVTYNVLCVIHKFVAQNAEEVLDYFAKKNLQYLQFIPCIDSFDKHTVCEHTVSAESYGYFLTVAFEKYYDAFKKEKYISIRDFDNYIGMLIGLEPESCAMRGYCGEYYVIEGDGSVYPCDFYVLDTYKMGNIMHDSFLTFSNCEIRKKFSLPSLLLADDCQSCRWIRICRGGCRRNREPFENGTPSLNRFCKSYRYFFDKCYDKMCEIARSII